MLIVRNILLALIGICPLSSFWDGLFVQGIVAGIAAIALILTVRNLRPGETDFVLGVISIPLLAAAIPALWMLLQFLPLGVFAHPIWKSAAAALHQSITGTISVDPGAGIVSLGYYLSLAAVALIAACVAVDRQRAEAVLLALVVAVTVVSLLVVALRLFSLPPWLPAAAPAQMVDCVGLGIIIAATACLYALQRHESRRRQAEPQRPWTLMFAVVALAICCLAFALSISQPLAFATGFGFLALAGHAVIRRFGLGTWAVSGLTLAALMTAILLVAAYPGHHGVGPPLTFANDSPRPLTALNQRVIDDAPLVGTGVGTFAALASIYREMDDPPAGASAATTAAEFATELGKPMFWLIVAAAAGFAIALLRASLRRGRDAFYPAMGGSCLITLLLLAFVNSGLLGTATGLISASMLGLAFAQSKSRIIQA